MNKILLGFLWVLTITFAYWFGITKKFESQEQLSDYSTISPQTISKPINKQEMPIRTSEINDLTSKQGNSETVVELPDQEIVIKESVFKRMRSSNPIIRMQAFTEALQNPTEENIAQAIEAYEKLPEGPSHIREINMLKVR